jgi:hypothetical protein
VTVFIVLGFGSFSLLASYVLFNVMDSFALLESKTHRLGGAVAGFVLLYGVMYQSYVKIDALRTHDAVQVDGVVQPSKTGRPVKVVLGVQSSDPDMQGTFRLRAPCIDPTGQDLGLYLVTEETVFRRITESSQMHGIQITQDDGVYTIAMEDHQ